MLEQRLVIESDEIGAPLDAPCEAATSATEKLPYEAPVLQVYRDMEDLLALDPPIPGQEAAWSDAEEEHSE